MQLRTVRPCPLVPAPMLFLLLFFMLCFPGCLLNKQVAGSDNVCEKPSYDSNSGHLSLFLNLESTDGPQVKLQLDSLEILKDGLWLPVLSGPREVDTKKIGGYQLLFGNKDFQPGNFEKVRLSFRPEVTLTWQKQSVEQVLVEPVIEISFSSPFHLKSQTSESVFLVWDLDKSFVGGKTGPLSFSLITSAPSPITANMIYVASPDINTIYAIRADKKGVSNSFFVGGRPTYLAIDDDKKKMYILCHDDGDIKVFDLISNSLIDVIKLPMTFQPEFMWVDDDFTAYVIDDMGYVSVVELQIGSVVVRKKIGQHPNFITKISGTNTIAVSSSIDSSIYILDDQTLEVKDQITVGDSPVGIWKEGDLLYVSDEMSNSVMVFDYNIRRNINSLAVGYDPNRLVGYDGKLFVANSGSGSISSIKTWNGKVTSEIPVGDHIYEMVVSDTEQLLYAGKSDDGDCAGWVSVIDITSNKVIGEIEIGSRPMGIVIGH